VLLGVQREFHHAFEEMVGRQAGEIVAHQFLDVETAEVSELDGAAALGIDKAAVRVVDDSTD